LTEVLLACSGASREGEAYGITVFDEADRPRTERAGSGGGAVYMTLDSGIEKKGCCQSYQTEADRPSGAGWAREAVLTSVTKPRDGGLCENRKTGLVNLWEGARVEGRERSELLDTLQPGDGLRSFRRVGGGRFVLAEKRTRPRQAVPTPIPGARLVWSESLAVMGAHTLLADSAIPFMSASGRPWRLQRRVAHALAPTRGGSAPAALPGTHFTRFGPSRFSMAASDDGCCGGRTGVLFRRGYRMRSPSATMTCRKVFRAARDHGWPGLGPRMSWRGPRRHQGGSSFTRGSIGEQGLTVSDKRYLAA